MRVMVTGGAGFIGSHIVDRLVERGDDVLVIDDMSTGELQNLNKNAEFLKLDIRSPKLVAVTKQFRPDVVSHLAAQSSVSASMDDPSRDALVNIIGGLEVLKAANASGCGRFIYVTTGGALYGLPDRLPCDEDHPIRPASGYGISKATLEYYLYLLAKTDVILQVLRLSNVFGPRQQPHGEAGVVAIFGHRMDKNQPVSIFGDGEQTRDFVYVDDVVEAHDKAIDVPVSTTVNISSGVGTSINKLFSMMAEMSDYSLAPVYEAERRGEVRHSVLDNRRALELLKWSPKTPIESGLIDTLDWISSIKNMS